MALIKCSECSAEISDKASCCPKCGAPVVVHKWRCNKCGNMISEEPCPYCSNAQTAVNTNTAGYESNVGTTPAFVAKNKRNLRMLVACLVITAIVIIVMTFLLNSIGSNKLSGQYTAQTAFSVNAITFYNNGNFVRDANAFGEWEIVGNGTYSLTDSSLTLYCSDGRVWEFYYNRKNDTMTQVGTSDVYIRTN